MKQITDAMLAVLAAPVTPAKNVVLSPEEGMCVRPDAGPVLRDGARGRVALGVREAVDLANKYICSKWPKLRHDQKLEKEIRWGDCMTANMRNYAIPVGINYKVNGKTIASFRFDFEETARAAGTEPKLGHVNIEFDGLGLPDSQMIYLQDTLPAPRAGQQPVPYDQTASSDLLISFALDIFRHRDVGTLLNGAPIGGKVEGPAVDLKRLFTEVMSSDEVCLFDLVKGNEKKHQDILLCLYALTGAKRNIPADADEATVAEENQRLAYISATLLSYLGLFIVELGASEKAKEMAENVKDERWGNLLNKVSAQQAQGHPVDPIEALAAKVILICTSQKKYADGQVGLSSSSYIKPLDFEELQNVSLEQAEESYKAAEACCLESVEDLLSVVKLTEENRKKITLDKKKQIAGIVSVNESVGRDKRLQSNLGGGSRFFPPAPATAGEGSGAAVGQEPITVAAGSGSGRQVRA